MNTYLKTYLIHALILILAMVPALCMSQQQAPAILVDVLFAESADHLTEEEREGVKEIVLSEAGKVAAILNGLPSKVIVEVEIIDRDLEVVDGITGRTDEHHPVGKIIAQISKVYPGGVLQAAKAGMKTLIFHEFHHLTRGWSIYQNEFEQGIDNAVINEGLAVVFAEDYTGVRHEVNSYTKEAEKWAEEILQLPKDANYSHWVSGYHPDGRTFIGYRTGNYVIRKAMMRSGMTLLELSELSPAEIYEMAGF